MSTLSKKKLGIIGGVGPAATALLFERIVEHTDARTDQDHLSIAVLNYPEEIPDRTECLLAREIAPLVDSLQNIALTLESLGCEVIALPCNTAHALFDEVTSALNDAVILHMPREVSLVAQEKGVKKCGILATDGTLHSRVYEKAFAEVDIETVVPRDDHQALVMDAIYHTIKAGCMLTEAQTNALFEPFFEQGCDGVVLGCTELSLMDAGEAYRRVTVLDALDILAQKSVVACGASVRSAVISPVCNK